MTAATATPDVVQDNFFIQPETEQYTERLQHLPHAAIAPAPEQPRKHPDTDLRDSIRLNGLQQPLAVRPARLPGAVTCLIVNGERGWRAAEGVLERVPCIIREDLDERGRRLQPQVVANTGTALAPIEEARAYAALLSEHESVHTLGPHDGPVRSARGDGVGRGRPESCGRSSAWRRRAKPS